MSTPEQNSYSYHGILSQNNGATAAAVSIVEKACGAGDDTHKIAVLNWACEGDNLKNLRDKIKESAN